MVLVVPHLVMDNNPDKLEAGYGMLIAPLVQAVKELSAKVDELQEFKDSFSHISESELNEITNTPIIKEL
jgi:hypothetical protein